jgi:hypothetical protein
MTIFFIFFPPAPGKAADPPLVNPGILFSTLSGFLVTLLSDFLVTLLTALSFSLASDEGFTRTEAITLSFVFTAFFFIPALSPLSLPSALFALQSKEITLANSFGVDPEFFILLGEICTFLGEGGAYTEGFSSMRCHTDTLAGAVCGGRLGYPAPKELGEPGSIADVDISIFLLPLLLSLCVTKPSWPL